MAHLYRYTADGTGVFIMEDELRPTYLERELEAAKWWLYSPDLRRDDITFYLTEKGKEMYDKTIKPLHETFLPRLHLSRIERPAADRIAHEDEFQVAVIDARP